MKRLGILIGIMCVGSASIFAQQAPTAEMLLSQGMAKAKAEHKNVLLDFKASWCPWCVRLDALYEDPKFADKFKKAFVIVPIVIVEREELKSKTNEGWEALMLRYRKHKDQDIPYEVILNPRGKQLADSYEKYGGNLPNNAGFPQTSDEIEAYLNQLKATAPSFTAADRDALRAYFTAIREKSSGHH